MILRSGFRQTVVMGIFVFALSGCITTSELVSKSTQWLPTREPTRMILVLSQARMDENGSAAHEGMLCRAYFFHGDEPVPVPARGDVVFTAYDQSQQGENRKPEGLYEIPAAELPKHLRKDIVGDSYLFWLPYNPKQKTQMAVQGKLTLEKKEPISSGVVSVEMVPAITPAQAQEAAAIAERARMPVRFPKNVASGAANDSATSQVSVSTVKVDPAVLPVVHRSVDASKP